MGKKTGQNILKEKKDGETKRETLDPRCVSVVLGKAREIRDDSSSPGLPVHYLP